MRPGQWPVLAAIGNYRPGVHGITDPEAIEAWWQGQDREHRSVPPDTLGAAELIRAAGYGGVELPLRLKAVTAKPKPTAARKSRPRRLEQEAIVSIRRRRQQRADDNITEVATADSLLHDEDEAEPHSAYDVATSLRQDDQRNLAAFVLEGAAVNEADISQTAIRATLRTLAGTVELKDPAVKQRFRFIKLKRNNP